LNAVVPDVAIYFFLFRRAASTRLGLPAGWPRRFFWLMRFLFSADDISDAVFGVFEETRLEGRQ
tara:strand:- start:289 stop:480 length:192 start_codon:yes stop_codon:yes gene_type:complete